MPRPSHLTSIPPTKMSPKVQLHLHLPSPPPPPKSPCSHTPSHRSLCRFARGYVFGHQNVLGQPHPNPNPNPSPNPTPSSNIPPPTQTAPLFSDPASLDFASLSLKSTTHANHTVKQLTNKVDNAVTKAEEVVVPSGEVSSGKGAKVARRAEDSGGGSSGGLKGYELPVHARVIERRSVVRRMRERGGAMSMDRLMRMMGEMGGEELGERETKWKWGKGKRLEGRGARAVFGGNAEWIAEKEKEGEVEDETGDELSFLIERCELDADRKQAAFMPYIT